MRISLAALDSTDIGLVRQWRNDHRIWRWTRQFDLISDAEQVRWFNRQSEDPTIRMYKVVLETEEKGEDDKPGVRAHTAGVCGFTSIDNVNRRAEFSLYVAPDLHGKGLGTVALKTLLVHGFQNLGLNIIWGETFDGNPAARMFEKIGFQKEGTRRQFYFRDGRFIDAHLYSITAEEFYARSSMGFGGGLPAGGGGDHSASVSEPDPEGSRQPDQPRGEGSPDGQEQREEKADCENG